MIYICLVSLSADFFFLWLSTGFMWAKWNYPPYPTPLLMHRRERDNEALHFQLCKLCFPPSSCCLQLESHYTYTRMGLHSTKGAGIKPKGVEPLSKEQLQHRGPNSPLNYTQAAATKTSIGIFRCNGEHRGFVKGADVTNSSAWPLRSVIFKQPLYCG